MVKGKTLEEAKKFHGKRLLKKLEGFLQLKYIVLFLLLMPFKQQL